jgi:hypothetical protein
MKVRAFALLLLCVACKNDPGGGELTGTSSPEAEARRATETQTTPTDTALTGTFGGPAPGSAPGTPAETGTHPGATGTDASTVTDPNVSKPNAAPNRTAT